MLARIFALALGLTLLLLGHTEAQTRTRKHDASSTARPSKALLWASGPHGVDPSLLPSIEPPAPEDVLGFKPGDDRKLASWSIIVEYFRRLDAASDRVKFEQLGNTTMGAPFVLATISAPENLARLSEYREIQRQLADPRTLGRNADLKARQLIARGKAIVLITCGVHSTEVGSTLSSMLIAHRLASSDEPEIREILKHTIILLVPSLNPDGVDIVKKWHDRVLGTPYEGTSPPELYHKYVGHDNNRDWYAFTQVETRLTVDKIHNAWHPQIVHDIHQQGSGGSRLFLPPYMQPVEPNVPRKIIEGYTELGLSMARSMTAKGFKGITWDSTYDAWTPARAYSHYHGGVRILSETASARLTTPINLKFEELRSREGYDPQKSSANFPEPWRGGDWHLRNVTDYMTTAAFELLNHASANRERWLRRFYEIGSNAVRPRLADDITAYVISQSRYSTNYAADNLIAILARGGVEVYRSDGFKTQRGVSVSKTDYLVPLAQPYGAFAKALLERQEYPNLRDKGGNPIAPYDVTAHTLPLLMGVKVTALSEPLPLAPGLRRVKVPQKVNSISYGMEAVNNRFNLRLALYKSHVPSMDEGWTRFILEGHGLRYKSIEDKEIKAGGLRSKYNVILIPDQSARAILDGHRRDSMPEEYTGGMGKEGVKALREFVEQGGTLITLNEASKFAIEQFELPLRDVTEGLKRSEFYAPGSILRIELDTAHPVSPSKVNGESIAWVEDSPVFEIKSDPAALPRVKIIARYPQSGTPLLSGWLLGEEKLRGRAALVEANLGEGRIFLFGFRPQYRAQSLATYPLLFNAITLAGRP